MHCKPFKWAIVGLLVFLMVVFPFSPGSTQSSVSYARAFINSAGSIVLWGGTYGDTFQVGERFAVRRLRPDECGRVQVTRTKAFPAVDWIEVFGLGVLYRASLPTKVHPRCDRRTGQIARNLADENYNVNYQTAKGWIVLVNQPQLQRQTIILPQFLVARSAKYTRCGIATFRNLDSSFAPEMAPFIRLPTTDGGTARFLKSQIPSFPLGVLCRRDGEMRVPPGWPPQLAESIPGTNNPNYDLGFALPGGGGLSTGAANPDYNSSLNGGGGSGGSGSPGDGDGGDGGSGGSGGDSPISGALSEDPDWNGQRAPESESYDPGVTPPSAVWDPVAGRYVVATNVPSGFNDYDSLEIGNVDNGNTTWPLSTNACGYSRWLDPGRWVVYGVREGEYNPIVTFYLPERAASETTGLQFIVQASAVLLDRLARGCL